MDVPRKTTLADQEEAAAALALLHRQLPSPFSARAVDEPETYASTPMFLSPDYAWYCPALVYNYLGIDRSLVRLCEHEIGRRLNTQLVLTPYRIMEFAVRLPKQAEQWWSTLQGVRHDDQAEFEDYLQSTAFRRGGEEFGLELEQRVLADPFTTVRVPGRITVIHVRSSRRQTTVVGDNTSCLLVNLRG